MGLRGALRDSSPPNARAHYRRPWASLAQMWEGGEKWRHLGESEKPATKTGGDARHVQPAKVKHQKYIKNSCKSDGGRAGEKQGIRQKNW